MSVGALNRIKAVLGMDKLEDDERLILAALVKAGYGEDDQPLGREGMLSSNYLAAIVYPLLWDKASPSITEEKSRMDTCKRRVRKAVNEIIIRRRIPVCCVAGYGGGYHLPATVEDVEANHHRLHKRVMTGLIKDSRGRQAAYADSMIQLTLGFESAVGHGDLPPGPGDGPPAWVQVVTGLLRQAKDDPEKYAAEIKQVQEECGDIFMRRDKVAEIRRLATALNNALEGVQV